MTRRAIAIMVPVALACAPTERRTVDSTAAAPEIPATRPVAPPDSAALATAVETLRLFLAASREGSTTRSSLPALTRCSSAAVVAVAGPMLAAYDVLEPSMRADTVIGRAVVTTVAEQDADRRHPGYYVARLRVRTDTLEWDVVPAGDGSWVVCNGLSFGLTAPDSLTAWRPDGASMTRARAVADSIASSAASGTGPR